MEIKELRSLSVEELNGRVKAWKEDLFRSKFKTQSNESKDTSVLKKFRQDIARAFTVITEKRKQAEV